MRIRKQALGDRNIVGAKIEQKRKSMGMKQKDLLTQLQIKGIDLNAPATRELVAELLFRAIAEASTVNYTPAFGYVTDKVLKLDESTLGYKNFKLVGKADADSFRRPATSGPTTLATRAPSLLLRLTPPTPPRSTSATSPRIWASPLPRRFL